MKDLIVQILKCKILNRDSTMVFYYPGQWTVDSVIRWERVRVQAIIRLQATNYRLQVTGYRLRSTGYRLVC